MPLEKWRQETCLSQGYHKSANGEKKKLQKSEAQ